MIRPVGARLLVKRLDAVRLQSELIVIPETVEDKPSQFALVLSIGTLKHGGVEVGDAVILRDFSGAPARTEFDGEMLDAAIVGEDEVLAVVEDM